MEDQVKNGNVTLNHLTRGSNALDGHSGLALQVTGLRTRSGGEVFVFLEILYLVFVWKHTVVGIIWPCHLRRTQSESHVWFLRHLLPLCQAGCQPPWRQTFRFDRFGSRWHKNWRVDPKTCPGRLRGGGAHRWPQQVQLQHIHLQRHDPPVHKDSNKGGAVVPGRGKFWVGADKILLPSPRNVRRVEIHLGGKVWHEQELSSGNCAAWSACQ